MLAKQILREPDYFDVEVISIKDIETASSTRENKDLLGIEFILCHEGTNKKGARFTAEELRAAQHTPIYKPINWEHDKPIFGVVSGSTLKQDEEGKLYIQCEGKIWKFKFPEFANFVRRGFDLGTLKMSMECWYTDFNVVVGDYDYVIPEREADADLLNAIGTTVGDKYISKQFINLIFGGVGATGNPADPKARILACASDRTPTEYHDYLHLAYDGLMPTPMTPEQIVAEHTQLHRENPQLLFSFAGERERAYE